MNALRKGIATGLILQLAIGPVFFYIINLTLQRSLLDGLAGVAAVTIVDLLYVCLSILGLGRVLEYEGIKTVFARVSAFVLIVFGFIIIRSAISAVPASAQVPTTSNLLSSFVSVFVLTISSPMTIIFFTSLFTAKAVEHNFNRRNLLLFGLGTGLATLLFMGISVIVFSVIKGAVPVFLIHTLNILVGCLLVLYGIIRFIKTFRPRLSAKI